MDLSRPTAVLTERARRLRTRLLYATKAFEQTPHTFILSMAVLIGILAGVGAAGFRYLTILFQQIFYGPFGDYLVRIASTPWYLRLLMPVIGGLILAPIILKFSETKGHGVPEVMESVAIKDGRLPRFTFLSKAVASAVCIGSGGSVGQEGPIVMIGASIGSNTGRAFNTSSKRMRTFVACGAAGGIAATFNAPIAGVMFAIEIIMGEFAIEHFSPIVLTSVTATAVSHWLVGDLVSFKIPAYELRSVFELGNYALLGVVCALVAVTYTNLLYRTEDYFERLRLPAYFKPALGGVVIGVLAIFYPYVSGVGYETTSWILSGKIASIGLLAALVFVKMGATSVSLGSGGSGGIFSPSLVIGAATGGALGYLFHYLFPAITAPMAAYAAVGMGALVAGTTHGPLTAILIIFEMTRSYDIILPLMTACITSTVLARLIQKDSIYTMKLSRRGIKIAEGKEQNVLKSLTVGEIYKKDYATISEDTPLPQLLNLIDQSAYFNFPVSNARTGVMTGIVSLNDIRNLVREEAYLRNLIIAKDIINPVVIVTDPGENLSDVAVKFSRLDVEEIPVVESKGSRKVIGVVTRKDVIDAYNRQMMKRDLL